MAELVVKCTVIPKTVIPKICGLLYFTYKMRPSILDILPLMAALTQISKSYGTPS